MGNSTRKTENGQTVRTFQPDDTDDTLYLRYEPDLMEIFERALAKWSGIRMDEIQVSADYIQTDCLGHDLHDPGDYGNFIVLRCSEEYLKRMKELEGSN